MTDLVKVPPVRTNWTFEIATPLAPLAEASRVTLVPETSAPAEGTRTAVVGGAPTPTIALPVESTATQNVVVGQLSPVIDSFPAMSMGLAVFDHAVGPPVGSVDRRA